MGHDGFIIIITKFIQGHTAYHVIVMGTLLKSLASHCSLQVWRIGLSKRLSSVFDMRFGLSEVACCTDRLDSPIEFKISRRN